MNYNADIVKKKYHGKAAKHEWHKSPSAYFNKLKCVFDVVCNKLFDYPPGDFNKYEHYMYGCPTATVH